MFQIFVFSFRCQHLIIFFIKIVISGLFSNTVEALAVGPIPAGRDGRLGQQWPLVGMGSLCRHRSHPAVSPRIKSCAFVHVTLNTSQVRGPGQSQL